MSTSSRNDFTPNESNAPMTVDGQNVAELSDEDLRERLKEFGVDVGPIVDSTRHLYRKKLGILSEMRSRKVMTPKLSAEDLGERFKELEDWGAVDSTQDQTTKLSILYELGSRKVPSFCCVRDGLKGTTS